MSTYNKAAADSAKVIHIKDESGTIPQFILCSQLAAEDLASYQAVDAANGWPVEMVNLAHQTRLRERWITVSHNCVIVGRQPEITRAATAMTIEQLSSADGDSADIPTVAPEINRYWAEDVKNNIKVSEYLQSTQICPVGLQSVSPYSSYPLYDPNTAFSAWGPQEFYDDMTSMMSLPAIPNMKDSTFVDAYENCINPGINTLVDDICQIYFQPFYHDHEYYGAELWVPRTGIWAGVAAVQIGVGHQTLPSNLMEANLNEPCGIVGVCVEEGMETILEEICGPDHGVTVFTIPSPARDEDLPTSETPAITVGLDTLGVQAFKGVVLGGVAFADFFSLHGRVQHDATTGLITVGPGPRGIGWNGNTIADTMEGREGMDAVEAADVAALRLQSFEARTLPKEFTAGTDPLKLTKSYQLAAANDYDLGSDIFNPSKDVGTETIQSYTFQQASTKVSGKKYRSVVILGGVGDIRSKYLMLAVPLLTDGTNIWAIVTNEDGSTVQYNGQDVLSLYMTGVRLENRTSVPEDQILGVPALLEKYLGYDPADDDIINGEAQEAMDEWKELDAWIQYPTPDNMPTNVRASTEMMGLTFDRTNIQKYSITGIAYGKLEAKRLFTQV
jgi:hypothetical protein